MTTCKHCGKTIKTTADSTLCYDCLKDYWTLVRQLGHVQLPALNSIMLKQARIGDTGHAPSKGHAPLPIDTHAKTLIDQSEAWLAEQAGKIRPQYANYAWRKAWLAILSNKHTVLAMPTAADDYRELEHITRRNEQALTPDEAMVIIGTCPHCSRQLQAPPDALTVACTCGSEWPVPAIKAQRDRRLWELEYTGRPIDVSRYLAKMDVHCTSNQIRQWLTRRKLHATPTNHKGEYVFNLGEIVAMLDCHS